MSRSARFAILLAAVLLAACRGPESRPEADRPTAPTAQPHPTPAGATDRARAHTELGASYLQVGRLAVALQELNEALKADPNYVPAHSTLGLVHMELREDEKARASFERALRIDPLDPDANNSYGLFLCNRKREKESIRHFLAATKNPLYTTPGDAFVNAGICSKRAGDVAEAQLYLERAVALNPNDQRALINLAQLHHERKQMNVAKSYLTRYMQRVQAPDAASLWLGIRLERELGDRPGMMSYGAQLRDRFPDAPETKLFNEGRFE